MTDARESSTSRAVVGMYWFKTPDPLRLATFWGKLMGLPLADGASEQLAMLDFDHEHRPVTWLFERAESTEESPSGRVGLDVHNNEDAASATVADRAEALGATRVSEREQGGARWIEMRDPDGNPFRVFAPRPR
jgi:catechol 2,3-dioxygenase-like lactoylglutathione lyase family enzyme